MTTLASVNAMIDEFFKKPEPLHFRTQEGQPYGSESRKCHHCGIMIWPERKPAPRFTEDRAVWEAAPDNCAKAAR